MKRKPYWKPQHEVFIRGMLAHGDKIKAYLEAYPESSPQYARPAANRLLTYPHIRERIEPVMEYLQESALAACETEAAGRIEEEMMDAYQKRLFLAGIVNGEVKPKRILKFKDRTEEVEEDVNPYVVLRAIELDCKLEHAYHWKSSGAATGKQIDRLKSYFGLQ